MAKTLSKSQLKPRLLELLRLVEQTGEELVITDRGRPVVRLVPWRDEVGDDDVRGSVVRYDDPTEPVGVDDWEALR